MKKINVCNINGITNSDASDCADMTKDSLSLIESILEDFDGASEDWMVTDEAYEFINNKHGIH